MGEMFRNNRRTFYYLIVSNFFLFFGFRLWETMFNNFAVETIGIGPAGIGVVQALREVPGLLGFLLGFVSLWLSEVRIMAISVLLLGAGLLLTGQSYGIVLLVLSTMVMSFGFHFFYPCSNSVLLMVTEKRHAPKFLGQLGSINAVAAVVATGAVFLLAASWGYRTLFMVVGGVLLVVGLILLPWRGPNECLPSRRRIVLRRRYWLYYVLSFLMGSRRHIFTTFAVFLLVRNYGINIETTAILFLVNSVVNVLALRVVGQMVGRLGERLMLSLAFLILIGVFLGYAYVSYLPILFGLFVIDNVLFGFNLALTTYFQKISVTQEEITSNLSVEQTINHIAAVVVPIVGGTVWEMFGSQAPFLVGVGIVTLSLILTQAIRTPDEPEPVIAPAAG